MRNANRIYPLMNELAAIWLEINPDWRFMQLICNFMSWLGNDGFYIEDDKILEYFKKD